MNLETARAINREGFRTGWQAVDFDNFARRRAKQWLWEVDDSEGERLLSVLKSLATKPDNAPRRRLHSDHAPPPISALIAAPPKAAFGRPDPRKMPPQRAPAPTGAPTSRPPLFR